MSKNLLVSPQWIGLQENSTGNPKELKYAFHINDEDATIVLEDRNNTLNITNDPVTLVLVLNVNLGIRNHKDFQLIFDP